MDSKITLRQFAGMVAERLPAEFDGRNCVYGAISVVDVPVSGSETTPFISIGVPDCDVEMGYGCAGAYANYLGCEPAGDEDRIIGALVSSLIDAYNEDLISYLKKKPLHDALLDKISDPAYVASRSYPELAWSSDTVVFGADNRYGKRMAVPSAIDGISVCFKVSDETETMAAAVYDGMLDESLRADPAEFLRSCATNLNRDILRWLRVEDVTGWDADYPFGNSTKFPLEIDFDVASDIIGLLRNASPNGKICAASLKDIPLEISSVLLSRTGMLRIAASVGARRRMLVLPIGVGAMLAIPADDKGVILSPSAELAEKKIKEYISGHPEAGLLTPAGLFRYDVITGVLS